MHNGRVFSLRSPDLSAREHRRGVVAELERLDPDDMGIDQKVVLGDSPPKDRVRPIDFDLTERVPTRGPTWEAAGDVWVQRHAHQAELGSWQRRIFERRPVFTAPIEVLVEVASNAILADPNHEAPGPRALRHPGRKQLVRGEGLDELCHGCGRAKKPRHGRNRRETRSLLAGTGGRPGPRSTGKV